MVREWVIRSEPELYQQLMDTVVAGRRISKRLRTKFDCRFRDGIASREAKDLQEMTAWGVRPEDQLGITTRVLAHVHATVTELCGPIS